MNSRRVVSALSILLAVLIVALPAIGQESGISITGVSVDGYPVVQVEVELPDGVGDFDVAELSVLQNGEPIEDFVVAGIEEVPEKVGIVLAVDVSGSMEGEPLAEAQGAMLTFIRAMRPQDRIALVSFGPEVVTTPFHNSPAVLVRGVQRLTAEGGTSLYDAVVTSAGLFELGGATGLQRNLILLTDGADTLSTASLQDALAAVEAAGVTVFSLGLQSSEFDPEPLQQLAAAGNGLYQGTPDPAQLTALYSDIQRLLDRRLVVQFTATQQAAGDLDLTVQYRDSSAATVVAVPGFTVATTPPPPTTTTFPPPQVIPGLQAAPLDTTALRILAVAAIAVTVFLIVVVLAGPDRDGGSRLRQRLDLYGRARRRAVPDEETESRGLLSRLPLLSRFSDSAERVARRRGVLNALNAALEQANVPLRPGEAIAGGVALAVVFSLLAGLFTRSLLWAVFGFVVSLLGLAAGVQYSGTRERRRFQDQLPDTLTLLATSLRAGYSLLQAAEAVAQESPEPTSREFSRAITEVRLGRPVVDALAGIAQRMESEDWSWAVMAIEIQREVGGNLAEVLQIVADTMRARGRLRREIKALTAEGRVSAIVLSSLPFFLFAFLWSTNRPYLAPLIDATIGQVVIAGSLIVMGFGAYWMKKIVDIEV